MLQLLFSHCVPHGSRCGCLFSSLCRLFQTFSKENSLHCQELSLQAVQLDKTLAAFQRKWLFYIKMNSALSCVDRGSRGCWVQQNRVANVLFSCLFFCRAIYFAAYSKSKETFNGLFVPNSGVVHMSSAGFAGENLLKRSKKKGL